ncbi:MAG TPA: HD domain-containing protein, partial [Rudaea sp.]|nr:HD domain-containing protein [Rudaea sp.]
MKTSESKPTFAQWAQRERAAVGISPWWSTILDSLSDVALPSAAESELLDALDVLDGLRADEETRAACILYTLQQSGAGVLASVRIDDVPHLRDLIDGQQAAEKIWSLYAARSAHVRAEGLRRLLLAIIRDLRVVFILLARQLAALRGAAKASPERQVELAQLSADIHAPLAN